MNISTNIGFQPEDFLNSQQMKRPEKNLSHARITTQSTDSASFKRPLTAKGSGNIHRRPANMKWGQSTQASKEILVSQATTATGSRGNIVRLTSHDTKTFTSSKTGSRARIENKRVR